MLFRAMTVLLLVAGLGCSSAILRPDPEAVSSIAAGYPSLEFSACGQSWNGLGICNVNVGSALPTISVQGYYNGTLKVDSKRCGIDTSLTYFNGQPITIPLTGNAANDCIVTMTLEPIYPAPEPDSEIQNFRGTLVIKAQKKPRSWKGDVRKVTGSWSSEFDMPVPSADASTRIYAAGCGVTYDQIVVQDQLWVAFDLKQATTLTGASSCVLDGFVKQGAYIAQFDVLIAQYLPTFTQLPVPSLELNGETLKVQADVAVSVIGLDSIYEFGNKMKFKFNPAVAHTMRMMTTQGRLTVGYWSASTRSWSWKQ